MFEEHISDPTHDFIVTIGGIDKDGHKKGSIDYQRTMSNLVKKISNAADYISLGTELFTWDGAKFVGGGHDKSLIKPFRKYISNIFTSPENNMAYNTRKANEIWRQLNDHCDHDPLETNLLDGYIPFRNGIFNIKTHQLEEHDIKRYPLYCIPWNYDPAAKNPTFEKAIKQIVPDEYQRKMLLCYMAITFTTEIKYQRAIFLQGRGGNGKSIITTTLQHCLGKENFEIIPLQEMGERFNRASFMGKLANIDPDVSEESFKNCSFWKKYVTEEDLPAEFKLGSIFKFRNIGHSWNVGNEAPDNNDKTNGFYRRWILIHLNQQFEARFDNMDLDLQAKIDQNIPGAINYILSFLPDCDKYLTAPTIEENKRKWLELGNSVRSFYELKINADSDKDIQPVHLYKLYKAWCALDKKDVFSIKKFAQYLYDFGVLKERKLIKSFNPLTLKFDPKTANVYVNVYPQFTEKEMEQMNIYETEKGYYAFNKSDEPIIQKVIDKMPLDETPIEFSQNDVNFIYEYMKDLHMEYDKSTMFPFEDIYEVNSSKYTEDQLRCILADLLKAGKIKKKGREFAVIFEKKYRPPIMDSEFYEKLDA